MGGDHSGLGSWKLSRLGTEIPGLIPAASKLLSGETFIVNLFAVSVLIKNILSYAETYSAL